MPACAKPYAIAIEPSAVTIQDNNEMAPTFAMLVGNMMMPEPIMLTVTMNVSCMTFIFFCDVSAMETPPIYRAMPEPLFGLLILERHRCRTGCDRLRAADRHPALRS